MKEEAKAFVGLGDFARGIELCSHTTRLIAAAGLTGTPIELILLDFEAELYLKKTEYQSSRRINDVIVRSSSVHKSALLHANSLANILSIDVRLGVIDSEDEVQAILEKTRHVFSSNGYYRGLLMCDRILADFFVHAGKKFQAKDLYEKCVRSPGSSQSVIAASLGKLGDAKVGLSDLHSATLWSTTYLALARGVGSPLLLSWALRLLGDIFLVQEDDDTAAVLFTVALDEFTRMEVYCGKAECLVGLAKIREKRGEKAEAKAKFDEAGLMFERTGLKTPVVLAT